MFGRSESIKSEEINFTSLENTSLRLQETFKKAQQFPNTVSYNNALQDIQPYLQGEFADHDRESFDCHSFMFAVARREFNIPSLPVLHFEVPKRAAFEYETDWREQLKNNVYNSPEFPEYKKQMMVLTEDIYENSEHIAIEKCKPRYDGNGNETLESKQQRKKLIDNTTRRVLQRIQNKPCSKVVLISSGSGETFYDAHSSIILGIEKGGKDVFVLEKEEIASPVAVRRLSNVIEEYSRYYDHLPDLTLNICRKSINELVRT